MMVNCILKYVFYVIKYFGVKRTLYLLITTFRQYRLKTEAGAFKISEAECERNLAVYIYTIKKKEYF